MHATYASRSSGDDQKRPARQDPIVPWFCVLFLRYIPPTLTHLTESLYIDHPEVQWNCFRYSNLQAPGLARL